MISNSDNILLLNYNKLGMKLFFYKTLQELYLSKSNEYFLYSNGPWQALNLDGRSIDLLNSKPKLHLQQRCVAQTTGFTY